MYVCFIINVGFIKFFFYIILFVKVYVYVYVCMFKEIIMVVYL